VRVGQVSLSRGEVPVLIARPKNTLTPGESATTAELGPLVLVPSGGTPAVREVAPNRAQSLCGQTLDWLEVVRPSAG
jgi:hypothetical protein